jgi:hypothetical protein
MTPSLRRERRFHKGGKTNGMGNEESFGAVD